MACLVNIAPRPTDRYVMCTDRSLAGNVDRRVLIKKTAGHELETGAVDGHDWPILRTRNMRDPHGVPENDIAVLDGAAGLNPGGQAVTTLALVNVEPRGIHLRGVVLGNTDMSVDENGSFSYPGIRLSEGE